MKLFSFSVRDFLCQCTVCKHRSEYLCVCVDTGFLRSQLICMSWSFPYWNLGCEAGCAMGEEVWLGVGDIVMVVRSYGCICIVCLQQLTASLFPSARTHAVQRDKFDIQMMWIYPAHLCALLPCEIALCPFNIHLKVSFLEKTSDFWTSVWRGGI